MKFLTSSSSSSSTVTASSDANVHHSRNTPAGCIAGVFRRLLCLNNLPTHPSDHFKETDRELDKLHQCANAAEEKMAAPGIVARLMGIESFPQIDFSAAQTSPNSVARSRSMNSVELMKELASIQGRHRRAKSFRETPTFVDLQDDNFFILSFENEAEIGKFGGKCRKSEMGSGQKQTKQSSKGENSKSKNSKRRESIYEKNKENLDAKTVPNEYPDKQITSRTASEWGIRGDNETKLKDSSNILRPTNSSYRNSPVGKEAAKMAKPISHRPETELQLGRRRMKKRKDDSLPVRKFETESDSENSSPSSVLDIMKFPRDPEVTSCTVELPRLANSKSRRTLAEDLENYLKLNHLSNESDHMGNATTSCRSRTCKGDNGIELRKDEHGSQTYKQMWAEISKVAGKNTVQSNWIHNKEIHKFEYKEISGQLQMQILDELVGELVDHLVGGYQKKF